MVGCRSVHDSLFHLLIRVCFRIDDGLKEVIGLVVGNESELGVEVHKGARRSADNRTVRVRAAIRFVAVRVKTFAVEIVREDGHLHPLIRLLLVCGEKGLQISEYGLGIWMTRHYVGDLLCLGGEISLRCVSMYAYRTYHFQPHKVHRRRIVAEPCIRDTDHAVALASGDGGRHRRKKQRKERPETHVSKGDKRRELV